MTIQLDPYEELGVDRRAGSDSIKAAYKALAKTRHPDAGGGAEEWERLQTAYDVLMNPDLRRGYDEDGVIGQVAVDNDRAAAVQVIDGKVAEIINRYLTGGCRPEDDPRKKNVTAAIVAALNDEIDQAATAISNGGGVIAFFEEMQRRFVVIDPEALPENTLAKMLAVQIKGASLQIVELERSIKVREIALAMMAAYRFEFDPPAQASMDPAAYYAGVRTPYTWPQA